jgi:hypothetical protein
MAKNIELVYHRWHILKKINFNMNKRTGNEALKNPIIGVKLKSKI